MVEREKFATSHLTGKDSLATSYSVTKVPHFEKLLPLPSYTDIIRKPKDTTKPCDDIVKKSGTETSAHINEEGAKKGTNLPDYGVVHIDTTKI